MCSVVSSVTLFPDPAEGCQYFDISYKGAWISILSFYSVFWALGFDFLFRSTLNFLLEWFSSVIGGVHI